MAQKLIERPNAILLEQLDQDGSFEYEFSSFPFEWRKIGRMGKYMAYIVEEKK